MIQPSLLESGLIFVRHQKWFQCCSSKFYLVESEEFGGGEVGPLGEGSLRHPHTPRLPRKHVQLYRLQHDQWRI